ncbi:MAG: TolC family protein [Cytophagaceae bacterium]
MNKIRILKYIGIATLAVVATACAPTIVQKTENRNTPQSYQGTTDTVNTAKIKWNVFFKDTSLTQLITTALSNNQEFNIVLQDIVIAQNEIRARKAAYLPFINIGGMTGIDKTGRYTRMGAVDATTQIKPGKNIPAPLADLMLGATVSWEVDIWKKLRNAKKAATYRFAATTMGRNYLQTQLVSEIANTYYELMALDNQLQLLQTNIGVLQNALKIIQQEKIAGRVTELAVTRFEAEVFKNQSRQYYIMQQIVLAENRINFLVGRFPQPVTRNSQSFSALVPDSMKVGIPSQLLSNRPDIIQAERELDASKLDVKVARAYFYPTLTISGALGVEAFNPQNLISFPQSTLYSLVGGMFGPVINRNAIKAFYYSANARQTQSIYNYQRAILNGYTEVYNQLSNIENLKKSYGLKSQQVQALNRSYDISTSLFRSARADYMEVLLTQRDALESRFDLVETKKQQMNAMVNIYRALGGGW